MRVSILTLILLLLGSSSYSQFTDSLVCKFDQNSLLNTHFSDGDDLYLTFYHGSSKTISIWLYNTKNPKGKMLSSSIGWLSRTFDFEKPNPHIFKRGPMIFVITVGGYNGYSNITKIKNGSVQSKDSFKLKTSSFIAGKTLLYFGGTNDSMGTGMVTYDLISNKKHFQKLPSLPHLKGIVVDTIIFRMKDSTHLYSGFNSKFFSKILTSTTGPTSFVDFDSKTYFISDRTFYSTDGAKKGTQLIKAMSTKSGFLDVYASPSGPLLTIKNGAKHKTLLFNSSTKGFTRIGSLENTFPQPSNFSDGLFLYRGDYIYYFDKLKQDSAFLSSKFNGTFTIYDAVDYENSTHYFCFKNYKDTYNFYFVDTNLVLKKLNRKPMVSPSDKNRAFTITNSLFTHKKELYFMKNTSTGIEIRRFVKRVPTSHQNDLIYLGLYPNPTNDEITIDTDLGIISLTIVNTSGRLCHYSKHGEAFFVTVDVNNLTNGVYFVEVETNNQKLLTKFVKE